MLIAPTDANLLMLFIFTPNYVDFVKSSGLDDYIPEKVPLSQFI